jgi:hypothetical protein
MNKFNLQEEEKNRILLLHKTLIKEQVDATTTTEGTPKSIKDQLKEFIENGCVKNGNVVPMNSTNPQKQFAIKQESTKTPGKFRYLFIDNTVGMTDETGKFQILPNKWECPEAQTELSKIQQSLKKKWTDLNYKDELTPEEASSGLYQKFIVPNTEKYFPPNGLEMWGSAKGLTTKANTEDGENTSTNLEAVLNNSKSILKSLKPKASLCKEVIRTYYESYSTNSDLPQPEFTTLKRGVERCVAFYSKKGWGLFSPNIPKYIKELQGSTTKWRINI